MGPSISVNKMAPVHSLLIPYTSEMLKKEASDKISFGKKDKCLVLVLHLFLLLSIFVKNMHFDMTDTLITGFYIIMHDFHLCLIYLPIHFLTISALQLFLIVQLPEKKIQGLF